MQKRIFGKENGRVLEFTDVVVIGNGPSALSLSAFLSGYLPYYDITKPHPNNALHKKLLETPELSIIDRDFEHLPEGLHGRSNRAVSLLYDALVRPDADLGDQRPSCLLWEKDPKRQVSHVCLGAGNTGGSWPGFRPDTLTLSFGSWLDLPAYSFEQWLTDNREKLHVDYKSSDRIPCSVAAQYFTDYARILNLHENSIFDHAVVTSAFKITDEKLKMLLFGDGPSPANKCVRNHHHHHAHNHSYHWLVRGFFKCDENVKKPFAYCAKRLVLACGATSPKRLQIAHENSPFVLHYSHMNIDAAISGLKAGCSKDRANKPRSLASGGTENGVLNLARNYDHKNTSSPNDHVVEDVQKCKFSNNQASYCCICETIEKTAQSDETDVDRSCNRRAIDYQQFANWHKRLNLKNNGCHGNGSFSEGIAKFSAPVLIVGDGLSAADNVIRLLKAGVSVLHSFRKPVLETQRLAISRLYKSVYPRYNAVYKLMTSTIHCCLYRAYPATEVVSVSPAFSESGGGPQKVGPPGLPTWNVVTLKHRGLPGQEPNRDVITLTVSLVIISIGSEPNLRFLAQNCAKNLAVDPQKPLDPKTNPILVEPYTGRCLNDPTIYAMGPLVGDNLVRFLVGGSMAVARDLINNNNDKNLR